MAKKRKSYKSSKCPEPFNFLIDIAAGATMNAIANKMEDKHHYRKRGVPNPYRASAIGFTMGKINSTSDILKLGAFLGAMGSFDPDEDEYVTDRYRIPSSIDTYIPWEYDHLGVPKISNDNRYAWRLNCEDGSEYGVFPEDYETREEYNEALALEKESFCEIPTEENYTYSRENVETATELNTINNSETNIIICKISRLDNGKNQYFKVFSDKYRIGECVTFLNENNEKIKGIVLSVEKYTSKTLPINIDDIYTLVEE